MLYFDPSTKVLPCSCISTITCYHKLAVFQKLQVEPTGKKKPEYALSKLQVRKRRGEGKGRSGRKRTRPRDEDLLVIPAPDAIGKDLQQNTNEHSARLGKETKIHLSRKSYAALHEKQKTTGRNKKL
jgi:hypothetical protein